VPDDPLTLITAHTLEQFPPDVGASLLELVQDEAARDRLLADPELQQLLPRVVSLAEDPAVREAAQAAYAAADQELNRRRAQREADYQQALLELSDPVRRGELLRATIAELIEQFKSDPDPTTTADMRERAQLLEAADTADLDQWSELLARADLYVEFSASPTRLASASPEQIQSTLAFDLLASKVDSMAVDDPGWDQPVLPGLDELPFSVMRPLRSTASAQALSEAARQFSFAVKLLLLTWIRRGDLPDRSWSKPETAWTVPLSASATLVPYDPIPNRLRQQTWEEIKAIEMALADGPAALEYWRDIVGSEHLAHTREEEAALKARLVYGAVAAWLSVERDRNALRDELRRGGQPAIMLLHVCLGAVLEGRPQQHQGAYVTLSIDELIEAIGYLPRANEQRLAMRNQVWHWIGLLTSMEAVGSRRGRWWDRRSGQVIDMAIDGPLLVLGEKWRPDDKPYDPLAPPLVVTLGPSPWLERLRGKRWMLPDFGQVPALAAISDGRPSGTWARAIGLALHQLWRERAADQVDMRRPFTRRELLEFFPPQPTVWSVLNGEHPQRAISYWDQAIDKLKHEHVIGSCKPIEPLPADRRGQKRWRDWIMQEFLITPGDDGARDAKAIATKAKVAQKARSRRSAKRQSAAEAGAAKSE
jgi:hypothetical protein